ncbi:hypothetical protein KFU94_67860 [Chloroflexi bacterium TSY]|nr:hypothetical protein [Chloroflexi bacterium TSY]
MPATVTQGVGCYNTGYLRNIIYGELQSISYALDPPGNRTAENSTNFAATNRYDALNQLTNPTIELETSMTLTPSATPTSALAPTPTSSSTSSLTPTASSTALSTPSPAPTPTPTATATSVSSATGPHSAIFTATNKCCK